MQKKPKYYDELLVENPLQNINEAKLTPAMHQFAKAKRENPDSIIFFRMGDFYETFYQDAEICAKELGITLTARGKGETRAPLAGIPYHALDNYLPKLIQKGYKVAICEQTEDPKKAKGLVKREVVRVVTPGTVIESSILDHKKNNYLAAIWKEDKYAFALADISTGEFLVAFDLEKEQIHQEMVRFSPTEILLPNSMKKDSKLLEGIEAFIHYYDDYYFQFRQAYRNIIQHFDVLNLEGFGLENNQLAVGAVGALLQYLHETQKMQVKQIAAIRTYNTKEYMVLDRTTVLNLELLRNIREGTERGTLLHIMNEAITPMGSRLLRNWLLHPLVEKRAIEERQDAVEEITKNLFLKEEGRKYLDQIFDLERIIARVNHRTANARDLISLKRSLLTIPKIQQTLKGVQAQLNRSCIQFMDTAPIVDPIESAILEEAPATLRSGNLIKPGYNAELDEIRKIVHGGKDWIVNLEKQERERTGISSLKVGFTRVFGYYIEVTKANLKLVPEEYIRKQTTANGERFITPELKEKESIVLSSEEKILDLEYNLFMKILDHVASYTVPLQKLARQIATLDCIFCLAHLAIKNKYIRPQITDTYGISIKDGRHPVVEQLSKETFIPNDVHINDEQSLIIITGPNMAGKSTYLRQVALIQLMVQMGSFVPAKEAELSIADRIFTRVGASDDLTMGQSTFMVEMAETANILHNATQHSLLILDEIGRGTSTYDGVSIAWAVAEYIHQEMKAKALFATHYHDLNKLADHYPTIANYYSAVKEHEGDIIFLRKIIQGSTDKSYGIEVAKLAGLPKKVISRAKEIMGHFSSEDEVGETLEQVEKKKTAKQDTKPDTKEKKPMPEKPSALTQWM